MAEGATLYLVGTPIGNLEDLTLRAIRILGEVDVIAAEDTRRTRQLTNHLGLDKPLVSYHEHNKMTAGPKLVEQMLGGASVALCSDAGMPVVSDPGAELVALAVQAGVSVQVIPGPCAVSSALALSGMTGDAYLFAGFLPRENTPRRQLLENLKDEVRTLVFYEAPHRLAQTLRDLADALGEERAAAVCNDLTKFYEKVTRETLGQAANRAAQEEPKGEFVIVVQGGQPVRAAFEGLSVREHLLLYLRSGSSKKEAVKRVAADRGVPKNEIYRQSIELDEEES
ncbi:MAG: 16S rRNA (cytidine(1402)-2'-O)-methyltransferase [Eubacteriales bacterium]|nr:16S rRNA (cytidine(1402)-2'-O)-methyltransferase [Eubacteriales bacterium]